MNGSDKMHPKWYIYGAGGLGIETMDILVSMIKYGAVCEHDCCFVVDEPEVDVVCGFPVRGFAETEAGDKVTVAVGEPSVRRILMEKCKDKGLILSSVVSPDSVVSRLAEIGEGCIVAPLCSIQATARLGDNVAVNTASIVGHDVVVGEGAVLSSMTNLGGATEIGAGSYIGMGALVKEGLSIGKSTIIGMGSVVFKDVPDDVIALGNPARVVRRNEDQKVFK